MSQRDHVSFFGRPFGRAPRTREDWARVAENLKDAAPGSLAATARDLARQKAREE